MQIIYPVYPSTYHNTYPICTPFLFIHIVLVALQLNLAPATSPTQISSSHTI